MRCSARYSLSVVLAGFVLLSGSTLFGATLKPGGINSATVAGPGLNGNPAIRDLRTDFVRTWHVFADTKIDGILNPIDTRIGEFKNWWTPVSAATQHAHEIGAPPAAGPDYPSTAIDHQPKWTTNPLQGLPQEAGTIGFYMTYSHMDNANFDTEFYSDGTPHDTFQQRNRERNGYAMGWLTGETEVDALGNVQYGALTGNVKMDIFIHNGKSRNNAAGTGTDDNHNFGTNQNGNVYYGPNRFNPAFPLAAAAGAPYSTVSYSEPQVVQSNEMSLLARQNDKLMLVADYCDDFAINDSTSATGYSYGANDGYVYPGFNGGKYLVDDDGLAVTPTDLATQGEFDTVIASMDVREVNSYETTPGSGAGDDLGGLNAIHLNRTPQALLNAGVTDGIIPPPGANPNLYFYEDSFLIRDGRPANVGGDLDKGSVWVEGSTDGGVIAGLSGFDEYSQYYPPPVPHDPTSKLYSHWGEQQVIRIDFDKDTLATLGRNGITSIIFYDWGDIDPVTGQQLKPIMGSQQIRIQVDGSQNLYFDKDGIPGLTNVGLPGGDILFPENRIYIAQVEHMPEPATMIVLAAGASVLLARRKRRRK